MTTQQVDAVLAAANPVTDSAAATLQLRGAELELIEQIITTPVGSHPRAKARRRSRFLDLRIARWSIAAVAAAAAACVVLIWSLSGSTPNIAHAFPVLSGRAVLTPASLQQAMKIYGLGPRLDGLDLRHAHPVATPWGVGYVLTNHGRSPICVVAPASGRQRWGASCSTTDMAKRIGTLTAVYSYDRATDTARFLTLLPGGATATAQLPGSGRTRSLPIRRGVLAFVIRRSMLVTIHVGDRVRVIHLTPRDAAPPRAGSTTGSWTTATSAESPTPTSRLGDQ